MYAIKRQKDNVYYNGSLYHQGGYPRSRDAWTPNLKEARQIGTERAAKSALTTVRNKTCESMEQALDLVIVEIKFSEGQVINYV